MLSNYVIFGTDILFISIEMLKNRSLSISCVTLSQFEEMVEFLISKFCCNDKSSSVTIGYISWRLYEDLKKKFDGSCVNSNFHFLFVM